VGALRAFHSDIELNISTFSESFSPSGDALFLSDSTLSVSDSAFHHLSASHLGDAVFVDIASSVVVHLARRFLHRV
jgi:hypothetical protein